MFGCKSRSIALLTLVVHTWINLVFAPWHQLVEHQIPAKTAAKSQVAQTSERRCRCGHSHCKVPKPTHQHSKSTPANEPIVPDDHDDCTICQTLAQPQTQLDVPTPLTSVERVEFVFVVSHCAPVLGDLIPQVSRGPPTA